MTYDDLYRELVLHPDFHARFKMMGFTFKDLATLWRAGAELNASADEIRQLALEGYKATHAIH